MTDFETTAEERSSWLRDTQPYGSPEGWWLGRLLRDFDRHAARIAELEAEVARLIAALEAKTTTGEKEIARLEAEARRSALSTEELNDD